ncbi:hypothetical protein LXL04_038142 [Taraxacum kok-saghyz]
MIKSMERPWSDLNHDVLNLVIMKLEVVDFLAFSKVCKSWRSLTVSNRNKFLVSKPPMSISISYNDAYEKECYLEDFEGRKLKTIVPHLANRTCVGITCGYLILCGAKEKDFWLVNPITRHELHFPDARIPLFYGTSNFKGILVFSHSISGWVFVVFDRCLNFKLWLCIASKQEWTYISTMYIRIVDLIAFKGNIYTLVRPYPYEPYEVRICEMKLYPKPELVSLISNPKPDFRLPEFVSSVENLYVIDRDSRHPNRIDEIDLDEMKWVSNKETGKKYALFRDNFLVNNDYSYTLRELCANIHSQYGIYAINDKEGKGLLFHAKMWYFLDDCLNVNLIHE